MGKNRERLGRGGRARGNALESQSGELQSEMGLLEARRDAIQSIVEFVNTSSAGTSGLGVRAQIEELARSVPAALSQSQGTTRGESTVEPSSSGSSGFVTTHQPSGIWALAPDLIPFSAKIPTLPPALATT